MSEKGIQEVSSSEPTVKGYKTAPFSSTPPEVVKDETSANSVRQDIVTITTETSQPSTYPRKVQHNQDLCAESPTLISNGEALPAKIDGSRRNTSTTSADSHHSAASTDGFRRADRRFSTARRVAGDYDGYGDYDDNHRRSSRHSSRPPSESLPLNVLRDRWRRRRDLTDSEIKLLRADHDHKFHNFYKNIGAIATLGASITFLLIPVPLQPTMDVSKRHFFDDSQVRVFLTIAWLLFMIVIGLSIFFAGIVKDRQDIDMWDSVDSLATAVPYLFLFSAIMFLGLVIVAYVEVVGFITVGLTASLWLIILRNLICGEKRAALGGSGLGRRNSRRESDGD
jgi:hypothetical protein